MARDTYKSGTIFLFHYSLYLDYALRLDGTDAIEFTGYTLAIEAILFVI